MARLAQSFLKGRALGGGSAPARIRPISNLFRIKALWPLALVFLVTLLVELALVERKYAIFGGGFGSSHVINSAGEFLLFATGLALTQGLLVTFLYLVIRAFHRRKPDSLTFLLNFLFVGAGGSIALLVAKYEVLSYFSDAFGFELMRSLGGGSLADAALFVASDAALMVVAVALVLIGWWFVQRLIRRFLHSRPKLPAVRWRHLSWLVIPLPILAFAAGRDPDVRYGLSRFNAFALANGALGAITDFDQDGYSWFTPQIDFHPLDPSRHPFALDVPNNGVDEDGLGGDLRFSGKAPSGLAARLPERPKHLVLVVLESVRGDAIGKVVGGRPVTPVLNALAAQGSYITEAYSHVGFTTESLKSLFSGRLSPARNGSSLFRDLKANGYRIGVFSGQPESFGAISETVGMKESADIFVDGETLKDQRAFGFAAQGSILIDGGTLLQAFDRSFGSPAAWQRPVFLYVNFQEAHFPYRHPGTPKLIGGDPIPRGKISAENRQWVEQTYWNAVAYDDRLIGELIGRLKRLGVWDETLLVVTADHGESLFDDDFLGHGHVINRQQTRIPLILSATGVKVTRPVGLSDYRNLILRALGANLPPGEASGPVFQHIGSLDAPVAIGIVERGGIWTSFQFETEELWFSDSGRRTRYAKLADGSPDKARAERLFEEWARQRWLARLTRSGG
jgi:hypothetical protein